MARIASQARAALLVVSTQPFCGLRNLSAIVIDIDIIIKPSRAWASMHANTADGRAWMAYNIVRAESVVLATFPASVADELAAAIRRAGLKTVLWELVETEWRAA